MAVSSGALSSGALSSGALSSGALSFEVAVEVVAAKPAILATLAPSHPRLIACGASWDEPRDRRAADARLDAFLKRQEAEARALLNEAPLVYRKKGR